MLLVYVFLVAPLGMALGLLAAFKRGRSPFLWSLLGTLLPLALAELFARVSLAGVAADLSDPNGAALRSAGLIVGLGMALHVLWQLPRRARLGD